MKAWNGRRLLVVVIMAAASGCKGNMPAQCYDSPPIESAGDVGPFRAIAQATDALLIAYPVRYSDSLEGDLRLALWDGTQWKVR
jgi:hypothetical protein